jgi:hypothetical protein
VQRRTDEAGRDLLERDAADREAAEQGGQPDQDGQTCAKAEPVEQTAAMGIDSRVEIELAKPQPDRLDQTDAEHEHEGGGEGRVIRRQKRIEHLHRLPNFRRGTQAHSGVTCQRISSEMAPIMRALSSRSRCEPSAAEPRTGAIQTELP